MTAPPERETDAACSSGTADAVRLAGRKPAPLSVGAFRHP